MIGYRIIEHIGDFGEPLYKDSTKELNIVSYGEFEPVLDIRAWRTTADEDGNNRQKHMLEGITLTDREAYRLMLLLVKLYGYPGTGEGEKETQ